MRKKIGVLLMGALLACIPFLSHAAPPAPLQIGDKVFITVPVTPATPSGGTFYFEITNFVFGVNPSNDGDGALENVAKEVLFHPSSGFNVTGLVAANTWLNEVEVPFDAGLSVLLGAGAIAAMKRSRNRRKEAAIA